MSSAAYFAHNTPTACKAMLRYWGLAYRVENPLRKDSKASPVAIWGKTFRRHDLPFVELHSTGHCIFQSTVIGKEPLNPDHVLHDTEVDSVCLTRYGLLRSPWQIIEAIRANPHRVEPNQVNTCGDSD